MALKGVNLLNSILNEFLIEFDVTADIGPDFCYWHNRNAIEYSLVVSDKAGELYMNYVHKFAPDITCDVFLISFLHELGHHETIDELTDEEEMYCRDVKTDIGVILSENKDLATRETMYNLYFGLPDELAATSWAIEYIRSNREKIAKLWNRIQPTIMMIYELNDVNFLEGE